MEMEKHQTFCCYLLPSALCYVKSSSMIARGIRLAYDFSAISKVTSFVTETGMMLAVVMTA